jgi:MFS family permease
LVGFAFFLISAFWQAYDSTIALTLTNKFGMNQTWSGVVMALDNILALFMLPLFGTLSDKHTGKSGRRTPFIRFGTIVAAVALVCLSFIDNTQLNNLTAVSAIDDPAALETLYEAEADRKLMTPEGEEFVLSEVFTKEAFCAITSQVADENGKQISNPDYAKYVVPARQAYASDQTSANPMPLILFICVLLVILVAMATFRSPAVALMPDVTMKPLRSKGNAVINLMGTAGGILVLVLGIVFGTSNVKNALMSYSTFYGVLAAVMLGALTIFLLNVKEKQWAAQMQSDSIRYGIEEQENEAGEAKRALTKSEIFSLICILLSVALWYFGYNAVTSKYSVYAPNVLGKDYNTTMLIAQGFAIVAYLPAGMVASKIGRKKTILGGVVMLAAAFSAAAFMRPGSPTWLMNAMFALAGVAWATINVNSFPMVVEMCSGADVGKYTGFYYTASMAAQTVTPMLSGYLMDQMGMTVLFPYAAIFVALAFVTMLLTRHGDAKIITKQGLEAFDNDD